MRFRECNGNLQDIQDTSFTDLMISEMDGRHNRSASQFGSAGSEGPRHSLRPGLMRSTASNTATYLT